MKIEVDRDVLVWLHKQPCNVFLTVLGAILGLVTKSVPAQLHRHAGRVRAGARGSVTTGWSTC